MKDNLIIPENIIVGLQNRRDSLTDKLGFVTFHDGKIFRQEKTWNNWRDQTQEPLEFKNEPTSGFILNKGVKRYGYYGSGRSVVRVYDPRGFEFEISVDNLMFVLMHSDVSKQDIQEKCIYAWNGKNLVLLPINSEEYQDSVNYTNKQTKKIAAKDLVVGNCYSHKKEKSNFVYIGRQDYYYSDYYKIFSMVKDHVFYNIEKNTFEIIKINLLAELISDNDEYQVDELIEQFKLSIHGSAMKEFTTGEFNNFSDEKNKNKIYRREYSLFKTFNSLVIEKISIYYFEFNEKKYVRDIDKLMYKKEEERLSYNSNYNRNSNIFNRCKNKNSISEELKEYSVFVEVYPNSGHEYLLDFEKTIEHYVKNGYSDNVLVKLESGALQNFDYLI